MSKLSKLSDAATQGEWRYVFQKTVVHGGIDRVGVFLKWEDAQLCAAIINAYRAGELAEIVPKDIPDPRIEEMAKEIYDGFVYDGKGEKPEWVEGGNGIRQNTAKADRLA